MLYRSELFGLSDDLLYAFRRTGGRFAFHAAIPDTVSRGKYAMRSSATYSERLQRYESWLRRLPPVAAIERIAANLGLLCPRCHLFRRECTCGRRREL